MLLKKTKHRSILDKSSKVFLCPEEKENFLPINGVYDENTNIWEIHKYLLSYLNKEIEGIPALKEKIEEIKKKLERGKIKIVERKNLELEVKKLEEKVRELKQCTKKKEYLDAIEPLLEVYAQEIEREGPHVWNGAARDFNPRKLSLVRGCIQIASRYAPIHLVMSPQSLKGKCPYCREPVETDNEMRIVCNVCDFNEEIMIRKCKFIDFGSSGGSGGSYSNKEIFIKTLMCHQGKQTVEFPKDLVERVDRYCEENDINKKLLYADDMRDIFKKVGYVVYDNINLFLHLYIKKKLPDLSPHEANLISDYDAFMPIYNTIKGDEKGSALNARYILYILVVRRGIPHDRRDFQLPDTPLRSNDTISRQVFNILQWEFKETA